MQVRRRKKRRRTLGKIKMQRDRVMQAILQSSKDKLEVQRLQKKITDLNSRISSLAAVQTSRPTAEQVCFKYYVYAL